MSQEKYEFNKKVLNELYSEIQETCLTDGIPLPTLIVANDIPIKYRLNPLEIYNIKISEDKTNIQHKKNTEYEITRGENKNYNTLYEYWEDELDRFLNKYPQFKNIIHEQ